MSLDARIRMGLEREASEITSAPDPALRTILERGPRRRAVRTAGRAVALAAVVSAFVVGGLAAIRATEDGDHRAANGHDLVRVPDRRRLAGHAVDRGRSPRGVGVRTGTTARRTAGPRADARRRAADPPGFLRHDPRPRDVRGGWTVHDHPRSRRDAHPPLDALREPAPLVPRGRFPEALGREGGSAHLDDAPWVRVG